MKTTLLSFLFLTLLSITSVHAKSVAQPQIDINEWDTDYPVSYTARIKRFRHSSKGLDYFDPAFIDIANYWPRIQPKTKLSKASPYNFSNFKEWAKQQNSTIIWRYTNDANYRKIVDNWNRLNNPFWTFSIHATCPFGTFDFSAGLKNTNEVILVEYLGHNRFSVSGYNVSPYKLAMSSTLGRPYTGRIQAGNTDVPPIGMVQLPRQDLKNITVSQQSVEKIDFTKHVPSPNFDWKYERLSNPTLSVSEKFNRKRNATTNSYSTSNAGVSATINGSQNYYNNAIGHKTTTINKTSTSNQKISSGQKMTKAPVKVATSNN